MLTPLPAHPGIECIFDTEMEAESLSPENMQSSLRVLSNPWAEAAPPIKTASASVASILIPFVLVLVPESGGDDVTGLLQVFFVDIGECAFFDAVYIEHSHHFTVTRTVQRNDYLAL